jgi:amidase
MQAYLAASTALNPAPTPSSTWRATTTLLAQADAATRTGAGRSRGLAARPAAGHQGHGHARASPPPSAAAAEERDAHAVDSLMTARMKAAGCIVVGKTNMPEFGLGLAHLQPLFGTTPNAWDEAVTAGGSSGGAAVALALRLLPVADGSDFMGSCATPRAGTHIFGMRPSQGRVPFWPAAEVFVASWAPKARWPAPCATWRGCCPRRPAPTRARRCPSPTGGSVRAAAPTPRPARPAHGLAGRPAGPPGDGRRRAAVCELALAAAWPPTAPSSSRWPLGFGRRAVAGLAAVAPRAGGPQRGGALASPAPRATGQARGAVGAPTSPPSWLRRLHAASEVRTAFYQHLLCLFERFDVLALPATQVWPFPIGQTLAAQHGRPHHGHLPPLDGGDAVRHLRRRCRPSACRPASMPTAAGRRACS